MLILDKTGRVCFNTKSATPAPVHKRMFLGGEPDSDVDHCRYDAAMLVGVGEFAWMMAVGVAEDKAAETAKILLAELDRRFPPGRMMLVGPSSVPLFTIPLPFPSKT